MLCVDRIVKSQFRMERMHLENMLIYRGCLGFLLIDRACLLLPCISHDLSHFLPITCIIFDHGYNHGDIGDLPNLRRTRPSL